MVVQIRRCTPSSGYRSHHSLNSLCLLGRLQRTACVRQPRRLGGSGRHRDGGGGAGFSLLPRSPWPHSLPCSPGRGLSAELQDHLREPPGLPHPASSCGDPGTANSEPMRPFVLKVKICLPGEDRNVEDCLWYFPPFNLPKETKELNVEKESLSATKLGNSPLEGWLTVSHLLGCWWKTCCMPGTVMGLGTKGSRPPAIPCPALSFQKLPW